jgi:O-antigen biosynthesis protein
LRILHRILEFISKGCAGYLGLTILILLPLYRRCVPLAIRKYVSAQLPAKLKRPSVLNGPNLFAGYKKWISKNEKLGDHDRHLIRAHIASFVAKPKFSILMPVYDTSPQYLREAIDSVASQLYPEWELCAVDDASPSAEVRQILLAYAERDSRIKVRFRKTTGGISANSNTTLEMATGEWIVLMDHDDTLAEHALYLVAEAINRNADLAIIYSDEDHIDENGRRSNPYFKPDWDYDLFLGQNLINHLGAYRTDLARQVGGFREGLEGSQDWDFALRVLEKGGGCAGVYHIPFVLYHWRQTARTFSNSSLTRAVNAACQTVSDHLRRTAQAAEVTPLGQSSYLKIKRLLPVPRPLVSVIIPTKDQYELLQKCIDGLVSRTDYGPVEFVIVDNGSSEPNACDFLRNVRSRRGFTVVEDDGAFNFSRLVNRGVAASLGEICVLLNNDVDVINADWLDELVVHALRPEVGVVGAKLYYPDDTLQHGGVILGIGGVAAHQHKFAPREAHGYFGRLKLVHGLSCVTAACLAFRRAIYDEAGGLDEEHLTVAFNDVDFCIRVRQAGYKIVWTPHAELYHYESRSRGYDTTPKKASRFAAETNYMRTNWSNVLDNDPFYNPNLSLTSDFLKSLLHRESRSRGC